MGIVGEATYEDRVFRPVGQVDLPEHGRARLTVEPVRDVVAERRRGRIVIEPEPAQAIAEDPELARRDAFRGARDQPILNQGEWVDG